MLLFTRPSSAITATRYTLAQRVAIMVVAVVSFSCRWALVAVVEVASEVASEAALEAASEAVHSVAVAVDPAGNNLFVRV